MTEYSRSAKGSFTSTGNAMPIALPFQPTLIKLKNYTAYANFAASDIPDAWWDVTLGQGTAGVTYVGTGPVLETAVVTSGGFQTIGAGLSLQYGPTVFLGGSGGIAKTSGTVLTVTTTAAHGLQPGNWVTFQNLYQTSTTGMQQIAGIPFEVLTTATTTTFTIGWVGTSGNLTAITAGGLNTNASFKQILYPALYVPGVTVPWAITVSNGVGTVTTTAPHNFVVGQEIAFRIPSIYGAGQLNELPNVMIPASPQYFYVASVTSPVQFTFNHAPAITAFTVAAAPFTSFPGLKFPEVVAVGDVNSGGYPYTGGSLYPSPSVYNGYSASVAMNTINGPAIQGAYINATWQGFIIGAGNAVFQTTPDTSSHLVGESSDLIFWEASLTDISMP